MYNYLFTANGSIAFIPGLTMNQCLRLVKNRLILKTIVPFALINYNSSLHYNNRIGYRNRLLH